MNLVRKGDFHMRIQKPIVKDNISIAKNILNGNKNLTTVEIINSTIEQSTIITPITIHINSVTDTIAGEQQGGPIGGSTIASGTNCVWVRNVSSPSTLRSNRKLGI
jgi:hypothetical protein